MTCAAPASPAESAPTALSAPEVKYAVAADFERGDYGYGAKKGKQMDAHRTDADVVKVLPFYYRGLRFLEEQGS